jgi:hypothetical protein
MGQPASGFVEMRDGAMVSGEAAYRYQAHFRVRDEEDVFEEYIGSATNTYFYVPYADGYYGHGG